MLRRLYVPDGKRLTLEEKVALTRGFADAVEKDRNDPDVSSVLKEGRSVPRVVETLFST